MDYAMVQGLSDQLQRVCLCVVICWLAVASVEGTTRWGLFDIEGWVRQEEWPACACSRPPCAIDVGDAIGDYAAMLL
eukprot:gene3832-51438_t